LISLREKTVALVGGAGFIGHNLALALAQRGAHVHVIDGLSVNSLLSFTANENRCAGSELYLRIINERLRLLREAGVQLHVQDAREAQGLMNALREIKPNIVVHLAGISNARQSDQEPAPAFAHTLSTLQNTLEASRGHVEHLVYFSSSMVYGDFVMDPVPEDAPCQPKGVYAALKLAGEHLVKAHEQVFGLPYTIVRPSALYGERCVSRRVIQVFIENAAIGKPVTISGDGSDRLDFTYVADLVDGLLRIMQHKSARNETFNLTYGGSRSIAELAELLEGEVGGIRVNHQPRSHLLPKRGALSIEKARSLLGYQPGDALETGLKKYVAWYRRMEPTWFRTKSGEVSIKPMVEHGERNGSGVGGAARAVAQ